MGGGREIEASGCLNKHILKRFVEFECERQLFLNLGRGDERWMRPVRPVLRKRWQGENAELLQKLGHEYEQEVYEWLLRSPLDVRAEQGSEERVSERSLDADSLDALYESLEGAGSILLEHSYETRESFVRWLLALDSGVEIPIEKGMGACRPDLLVVESGERVRARRRRPDQKVRMLAPGGELREVESDDVRCAVRIIDVKHTHPENVGKKQFLDLLYYAHALAFMLAETGLDERFFVALDGHGILPNRELESAKLETLDDLDAMLVPMEWDDHAHLFEYVARQASELRAMAPCAVEDVPLRIQPACARCRYIADCKDSLGYDEGKPLAGIDVRLVPYTTPSIARDLRDRGVETVRQLHERLDELEISTRAPSPLYAERPLLRLKAESLVHETHRQPDTADPWHRRHLSMAIPPYSNVMIAFCAEADPTNDCVFAFGFDANIRCYPNSPYFEVHEAWWSFWKSFLERGTSPERLDIEQLIKSLDERIVDYYLQGDSYRRRDLGREDVIETWGEELRRFAAALRALEEEGALSIGPDYNNSYTRVRYEYGAVSGGLASESERELSFAMVRQFHNMLTISSIYEKLVLDVRCNEKEEKLYALSPNSAIFYWSADQLMYLQEMLERHLPALMTDPSIRGPFEELMKLFNPSESGVQRDYLHKKAYNARDYAETTLGLPQIINYTWHEIAEQQLSYQPSFDERYWNENFNFMDFSRWHEFLMEAGAGGTLRELLRRKVVRKAKIVGQLVRSFQSQGRGQSLRKHYPIESRKIDSWAGSLDSNFNFPARVLAMFAKLTAAVQAQEALHTRLTFPARSIGKLVAARAEDIETERVEEDGKTRVQIRFVLRGMSANAKFKEGAHLLLIHESKRGAHYKHYAKEIIVIDEMSWDASEQLYRVEAHGRKKEHPAEGCASDGGDWYLYPNASDYWCGKLFKSKGNLLSRENLGASWLGERFAAMGDLLPAPRCLERPEQTSFRLAELYVFAPDLLPAATPGEEPLRTTISPEPDASQREAIRTAMSSTVSCIQGPPGTGKSQTIAALVDEFVERRAGRPTRILVVAQAYAPLQVALGKIRTSENSDGRPTRAAGMQKLYLRSESRDPYEADDVHDMFRTGNASLYIDGERLSRAKGKKYKDNRRRLEDELDESFIVFAPAQQLFHLGKPETKDEDLQYIFLHNDFGFDLIVVDEASQMPVDKALTSLTLVHRGEADVEIPGDYEPGEPIRDRSHLEEMEVRGLRDWCGEPMAEEGLTKVVFVGDHNQLPPVQPVEPSEKLSPILGSLFEYYVEQHGVPRVQLRVNYRSRDEIVRYTQHLGIYERAIETFHTGAQAYEALPSPPDDPGTPDWLQHLLTDDCAVSALVHDRRYETAVSPLEARIITRVVVAFYRQMRVGDAAAEERFWSDHLGIVAPHNAQGRLLIRSIADAFSGEGDGPASHLAPGELMQRLRETIYSVEKFQGSARTFIIASMGISSTDQLQAEETFIYDMNRLNVLTSRARQKMLLLCSENFLDYIPRARDVVPTAARCRDYARVYCNRSRSITVTNEDDQSEEITMRWHDPSAPLGTPGRRVESPTTPEPVGRASAGAPPSSESLETTRAGIVSSQIPQTANLDRLATMLEVMALGMTQKSQFARRLGVSSRNVNYLVQLARLLGFVADDTFELTELGDRYVHDFDARDELVVEAIEGAPLVREVRAEADFTEAPKEAATRVIQRYTDLGDSTARRRARSVVRLIESVDEMKEGWPYIREQGQ